ncbi:HAAS signaling domain-containing protein [Urbifossiella limnaea]|uniref:Uncharacterized protein n=1 Tax=Urbifossiella limnaea TaxID=2528023 RepID=A0A517Y1L3_9BACT|nr:hypothetical protein [Urbifossiella limnaea]QDU23640.1 hypothetical protein ETAA1_56450 [Urbifossiella limnaea]
MTAEHTLGLTAAAEARLDDYLAQVRRALLGVPDVNSAEIEADIREHVENELRGAARPVELLVLEVVLRRLGPPTQWLPPGRVPVTAQVGAAAVTFGQFLKSRFGAARTAVWRGPEDWRLPYLSFGTFALGVIAFPLFPLCLVVSYILSRAGIACAADKGVALDGGRKWLLYPPVVIVSVTVVASVFALPIGIIIGTVDEVHNTDMYERWNAAGRPTVLSSWGRPTQVRMPDREVREKFPEVRTKLDGVLAAFPGVSPVREVLGVGFLSAGVLAAWWGVLGCVCGSFPGLVRGLVYPFHGLFSGRRAGWVGTAGLVVLAVWAAAAYRLAEATGLV